MLGSFFCLKHTKARLSSFPSDSGKRYLKRYLKMPSYSAKLLLSGKASIEISFSRSAVRLLGTAKVTF